MRTKESQPPVANLLTWGVAAPPPCARLPACEGAVREPGSVAGAHETALQPVLCVSKMDASHVPLSVGMHSEGQLGWVYDVLRMQDGPLKVSTDVLPSEDAHARMAPNSAGAQDTEFTVHKHFRTERRARVDGRLSKCSKTHLRRCAGCAL